MFKWIKRSNATTKRTLDLLEYKYSDFIFYFFNTIMVYIYSKIILNMCNYFIMVIEVLLYVPLFILFIFPSIFVEIFEYTSRSKIETKPKVNIKDENFDK